MAVYEVNNLVIEKGTDFEATFNLFDSDNSSSILSGLTTTYASIRKYPGSISVEEFSKNITSGDGTIRLSLTAEQTSRLTSGRNYFDVVLTIHGNKTKVIKGTAIVQESISV
jgi:hypothetical protein